MDMLKSLSSFLVPLYFAPPQKPLVRLCENCDFLFKGKILKAVFGERLDYFGALHRRQDVKCGPKHFS